MTKLTNANGFKMDGVYMAQENHARAIAKDNARAYSRACRIEEAKRKVAMKIIVGSVALTTLIGFLATEIKVLHNLIHIIHMM